MSKQFFHCGQFRASVQQVGRKRMPKYVRAALLQRAHLSKVTIDQTIHKRRVERLAAICHKQCCRLMGPRIGWSSNILTVAGKRGTTRSLLPLPNTRSSLRVACKSTSANPINSDMRRPVSYNNTKMALSLAPFQSSA